MSAPTPVFVSRSSLFKQACAKQNGNDEKRQENEEQNFRNRGGTFGDATKAKYGGDNSDNKKDNWPT